MNVHLTDDDFAAVVAGLDAPEEAAEHLASCVTCRHQVAELRDSIADRRRKLEAESPDWQRQRREVMARLPSAPTARRVTVRRWMRPLLAAAAVLVIAIGVGLLMPRGSGGPPATDDLPVEQILADVNDVLADDTVPGFESIDPGVDDPASIFANGTS